jgi:hypothetical protein
VDQFFKIIKVPEEILMSMKDFTNLLCHELLLMVALLCAVDPKLSDVEYIRHVTDAIHKRLSSEGLRDKYPWLNQN